MVVTIICACLGSSVLAEIVKAIAGRKSRKKDKLEALALAQKIIMVDRVEHVAKRHLEAGNITLHDKEKLEEMFTAYKSLGGNGDLDTVMGEIRKLRVIA